MLDVIKESVRATLPASIWNRYVELRLRKVAHRQFDSGNLRSLTSLELSRIFSDTAIAAAYAEDQPTVAALFGDVDKFGGVNPGDRRAIYFLIMALKPRNVLEVGTHIGASTIYIAAALKRLNAGGKLTTVDVIDVNYPEHGSWKKVGMSKSPTNFAAELSLLNLIQFHTGPSLEFMRRTNQRFDFVFLDGDHAASTVYQELGAALPLIHRESVVLLHDYCPDAKPLHVHCATEAGPFFALKRVRNENPEIEVLPLGELPWPTKLGTNITKFLRWLEETEPAGLLRRRSAASPPSKSTRTIWNGAARSPKIGGDLF